MTCLQAMCWRLFPTCVPMAVVLAGRSGSVFRWLFVGQLQAWATCHHWPTQTLSRSCLTPLGPVQGPASPQAEGLQGKLGSVYTRATLYSARSFTFNLSMRHTLSCFSPKTDILHARVLSMLALCRFPSLHPRLEGEGWVGL